MFLTIIVWNIQKDVTLPQLESFISVIGKMYIFPDYLHIVKYASIKV